MHGALKGKVVVYRIGFAHNDSCYCKFFPVQDQAGEEETEEVFNPRCPPPLPPTRHVFVGMFEMIANIADGFFLASDRAAVGHQDRRRGGCGSAESPPVCHRRCGR